MRPVFPASLVDAVCSELFLAARARERDDNLLFVRERLLRGELDLVTLLDTYARLLSGKRVTDEGTNGMVTALHLSGAVKGQGGRLRVRNRIYATVFDSVWVRENLPYAEAWRQQRAYRRGLARAVAASSLLVAILIGLVWNAYSNARRANDNARQIRQAPTESRQLFYAANMNLIPAAWEKNDVGRVLELLKETQAYPDRGFEWYYWQRMCHLDLLTINHAANCVTYSPDGKRIMTGCEEDITKIWDAANGRELLSLKTPCNGMDVIAMSPDGARIVTNGYNNAKVWEAATPEQVAAWSKAEAGR